MKFVILLAALAVAAARPEEGLYDSKYDSFDVKELIGNTRLFKAYALCFRSKGKCTPEGTEIKKWIPESLQTNCGKCTEKQKSLVAEVMKAIQEQLPEDWADLLKLYNPKGEITDDVNEFIQKYGPK